MITFKQFRDKNNEFSKTTVKVQVVDPDATLPDLLEAFEQFLAACGYHLTGHLVVEDHEEQK